jgi:hypothetical protein
MIDFVAYHNLQAQCGQSLFTELVKVDRCAWRINGNQKYTGADILIMLDHAPHHPDLIGKYKHRFYFPHDMGELILHYQEQEILKNYTAYFVPTDIHKTTFEYMFNRDVYNVGWLKFDDDCIDYAAEEILTEAKHRGKPVILYAPTNPDTWEWTALLRQLKKYTVIIKNHILTNPGQAAPKGLEKKYADMFKSVAEMEVSAVRHDMILAPRSMNCYHLFKGVDYLISDTSSLLAEFTPFGVSIETGRYNQDPACKSQEMSDVFKAIYRLDDIDLKAITELKRRESVVSAEKGAGRRAAEIIKGLING